METTKAGSVSTVDAVSRVGKMSRSGNAFKKTIRMFDLWLELIIYGEGCPA
jgi:hypothetical protein